MDKYTPSSTLTCTIATHPSYSPRLFVTLPIKPPFSVDKRQIVTTSEIITGGENRLKLGEPMADLNLEVSTGGLDDESMRVLEEIERRNVPVVVYTNVLGSQNYSMALNSNDEIENVDGGWYDHPDGITREGYLFILKADSGRGYFLEKIGSDVATYINSICTGKSQDTPFSLQRGFLSATRVLNKVPNALFTPLGSGVPDYWVEIVPGVPVAYVDEGSWLTPYANTVVQDDSGGAPPYEIITHGWIDVDNDKDYIFFVGYETDGTLEITIEWDAGAPTVVVTGLTGTGVVNEIVTIPHGAATCKIHLEQLTGRSIRWCSPFFSPAMHQPASTDMASLGYIALNDLDHASEPAGGGGVIKYDDLEIAPYISEEDGVCIISGYLLPLNDFVEYDGALTYQTNTVFEIRATHPVGNVFFCGFNDGEMFIDDRATRDTEAIVHNQGDAWFCTFIFGWDDHAQKVAEARFYNITTGIQYDLEFSAPDDILYHYDRLTIGGRCSTLGGAIPFSNVDGVMGGVSVGYLNYDDIDTFIASRVNENLMDLYAITTGRAFSIELGLSPSTWNRQKYDGKIKLTQTGRL